jgi:predicted HAD superfamily Cof-like phosphohydrolase
MPSSAIQVTPFGVMIDNVRAFHLAFGQRVVDTPDLPDANTRSLRVRLLTEEYTELFDAELVNDIIGVADALADICYILCGTAHSYGLADVVRSLDSLLVYETHRAELPDPDSRANRTSGMQGRLGDYLEAERNDDPDILAATIRDMILYSFSYASTYGIPLSAVFLEVHRSNMTKLGPDGTPTIREDGKVLKPPSYEPPDISRILFPGDK